MTALFELKGPKPRFARSINVERDAGGGAVDGYLPVGRAIDAISRLAAALSRDDSEVAFSITGPYGSGKSSLAVIIDALLGPVTDRARVSAEELLSHTAPEALRALEAARLRFAAHERGFVRALVTAQREPISATVLRGLLHGAERYQPAAKQRSQHGETVRLLTKLLNDYNNGENSRPEARTIRSVVASLGELAPVFLLIDEFGKNLEAFADSHSDADLFLLQELAEWTRGGNGLPLALVTMQHLAFDEYADRTSAGQRREWAKIQGRFEDIPFIDSPTQTRTLIASAFTSPSADLKPVLERWSTAQAERLAECGLNDLAIDPALLASCWPLHPISLAVLPELCERYGQNERTLFSFLAGREPLGVARFLATQQWNGRSELPVVRLDRVYDYFVESASTMVGVSSAASRWLEIDTRIRDSQGLDPAQLRVLKTVGLLNLVSAGGTLRASRTVISYTMDDGQPGTATAPDVERRLDELEQAGLLTFRDFADEYRVWQGSDFDLRSTLEVTRRRIRDESPAALLTGVLPLSPLIAGRHSHQTGTLRAFQRGWVDATTLTIDPLGGKDHADGLALYVLAPEAPVRAVQRRHGGKPVAFLTTSDPESLIQAAREVAAIDEVLSKSEDLVDDRVARRELIERRVEARAAVEQEFERAFGATSRSRGEWTYQKPTRRQTWTTARGISASQALSVVVDAWYGGAPQIHNELLNRHDLSSQAAKARRLLIDVMVANPNVEGLGIEGFGPDRTMYLSVLKALGFHRRIEGQFGFAPPPTTSSATSVWAHLIELLRGSSADRLRLDEIYDQLASPPCGLREGVAPVLTIAALIVLSDEVALYEHGTFRPVLTSDLLERLLRNPANFEVKHFASRDGSRARFLAAAADALGITKTTGRRYRRVGSVLAVLSHLISVMNSLPEYAKRTGYMEPDALRVRRQLLLATEPDELLFKALPEALGKRPIPAAAGSYPQQDIEELAASLARVVQELRDAFPKLLKAVRTTLLEELRGPDFSFRENLSVRARELHGRVVDQRIARLIVALQADIPGDDEWAEYVGMNVSGISVANWNDDDRRRFSTAIQDMGSTFRRLEALNYDLRARGDGFDALRVTVTRPDGVETAKLVWIDEVRKTGLAEVVTEMVTRATTYASSPAEARDLLLALLADSDLADDEIDSIDWTTSADYNEETHKQIGTATR